MSQQSPTHPGFFEVMATPRAYTTLLYLLLSLVTGILAFTYAVTGLSLSLGLAILILGLPLAVAFLAGARLLSVAELRLLGALVGTGEREAPAVLPAGVGWWERVKALVGDLRTWTSLLYFLLLLPLGTAYFTLIVAFLTTAVALLAVPVLRMLHAGGSFTGDLGNLAWITAHPGLAAALCGLAGLTLLPLTFHLALLLGRFQVWLARHLLLRL